MAEMKPQVYKDPRPAEYFDRVPRARARTGVGWIYAARAGIVLTPADARCSTGSRAIGVENVPTSGPADPRPQPLQPDGPLLRRRLPAPQDPLHGQVAAVRPAGPHLHLQARRRLPGPPRPPRRGGVQDRLHDPRPGRMLLMYAEGGRSRTRRARRAASRGSAGSRWSPARRSSRSRSTARRRCAAGSACASRR